MLCRYGVYISFCTQIAVYEVNPVDDQFKVKLVFSRLSKYYVSKEDLLEALILVYNFTH